MEDENRSFWDVIVIGGGPAGCAAALSTMNNRAGSVLLLEKEVLPRLKLCAGGITPWAVQAIKECGFPETTLRNMYPVSGARVMTGKGATFVTKNMLHTGVINRSILDYNLARSAAGAGVAVRDGVTVNKLLVENNRVAGVNTEEGTFESRCVIVANGSTSRFHRDERKRNYTAAILYRYEDVSHNTNTMNLIFDRRIEPYYAWWFPESAHSFNIGIGVDAVVLQGDSLRQLFHEIIDEYFGDTVQGRTPVFSGGGTILADSGIQHQPLPGSLIAGEAARLVHPFLGEGISCALHSGRLAGEAAAEGLREGLSDAMIESIYLRRLYNRLGRYLKSSRFLQKHGIQLLNATRLLVKLRPVRYLALRSLGCP